MWLLITEIRNRIRTVEVDFMRRLLQLNRWDRVRNEEIWIRMGVACSIICRLAKRALQWYGHVQCMPEYQWPQKTLKWYPIGRRRRRRRPVPIPFWNGKLILNKKCKIQIWWQVNGRTESCGKTKRQTPKTEKSQKMKKHKASA